MNATDLITNENYEAVNNATSIVKQDIAIQIAVNSLNDLFHVNQIQVSAYGRNYGITNDLLEEVRSLKNKLENAKYGRL